MSPYLFHMTTRESLKLILEDEHTNEKEGKLKVQIPRHSKKNTYQIPMVCFTDSPPFALDFFRYRWSDNKDRENLKYGIGFDKETMVQKGVFPTFYVPHDLQAPILELTQYFKDNDLSKKLECLNCDDEEIIQELNDLLSKTCETLSSVERLMFPLLEKKPLQGYIWEREWRYATHNNSDFVFSYDDIRIICCDDEDENLFKEIIGKHYIEKNQIQFIRTWQEYDEITDFLNRKTQNINNINRKIQKTLAEKKGIDRYIDYVESQNNRINQLNDLRKHLDEEIKKIALIQVFEKISGAKFIPTNLKKKIIESDCEILINAIAAYQASKKSNEIEKPIGYLLKAITEGWKPPSKNSEQELDQIRKQMNEIIENL